MVVIRLSKIVIVAGVALTCALAVLDNIVNPSENYSFVQHVLSMDTIESGAPILNRAITNPTLQKAAFAVIVTGEALTALLLWLSVILMLARLRAPATRFVQAKAFAIAGVSIGFLVWQAGFLGIGGEWFAMWMSKTWNGQEAAFRFTMIVLGALIYLVTPERDVEG
ncbi:DUF2165 family protein [Methylobacterium pseudosasicola]|uniref:Predicted small integral membrane protein n=1 Tax=Methylobacterium pseudosasicola TaxID=582667 RepID=A0A1I4TM55_9HYPH|nr:DUF2165 domain-containing protein [Methylobacterium pseudosasicola]SFM77735.1 Predicted small integral membrane protein [Methylobacterium pseudosasicola]